MQVVKIVSLGRICIDIEEKEKRGITEIKIEILIYCALKHFNLHAN